MRLSDKTSTRWLKIFVISSFITVFPMVTGAFLFGFFGGSVIDIGRIPKLIEQFEKERAKLFLWKERVESQFTTVRQYQQALTSIREQVHDIVHSSHALSSSISSLLTTSSPLYQGSMEKDPSSIDHPFLFTATEITSPHLYLQKLNTLTTHQEKNALHAQQARMAAQAMLMKQETARQELLQQNRTTKGILDSQQVDTALSLISTSTAVTEGELRAISLKEQLEDELMTHHIEKAMSLQGQKQYMNVSDPKKRTSFSAPEAVPGRGLIPFP